MSNNSTRCFDSNLQEKEIYLQASLLTLNILGNGLVIIILLLFQKKTLNFRRVSFFILQLAFADILVALLNNIPQLLEDIFKQQFKIQSAIVCKLVRFCQMFPLYLSSNILILAALDRFIAINNPLRNSKMTRKFCWILILGAYGVSTLSAIPQLIIFDFQLVQNQNYGYCSTILECNDSCLKIYAVLTLIILYAVPLICMAYFYIRICITIRISMKRNQHLQTSNQCGVTSSTTKINKNDQTCSSCNNYLTVNDMAGNQLQRKRNLSDSAIATANNETEMISMGETSQLSKIDKNEGSSRSLIELAKKKFSSNSSKNRFSVAVRKSLWLTFTVCVSYALCYAPFFVSVLWLSFAPDFDECQAGTVTVIALLLISVNSCCNPWIYASYAIKSCFQTQSKLVRRKSSAAMHQIIQRTSSQYHHHHSTNSSRVH